MRATVLTSAMTAAAVVGSLGAQTDTAWYRDLEKPAWQPPPLAFALVWNWAFFCGFATALNLSLLRRNRTAGATVLS